MFADGRAAGDIIGHLKNVFSPGLENWGWLGDEAFPVHAVAAGAEPSCDEGMEMCMDAFFDVVQFVRWDHLVAADAQAGSRRLSRDEPALRDWFFHLLPRDSIR